MALKRETKSEPHTHTRAPVGPVHNHRKGPPSRDRGHHRTERERQRETELWRPDLGRLRMISDENGFFAAQKDGSCACGALKGPLFLRPRSVPGRARGGRDFEVRKPFGGFGGSTDGHLWSDCESGKSTQALS